jgi:soluble lytic murein transglycosylase-like protein
VRRKWILGALLCVLAPVGARAQLDVSQRADGVFVFSNNPDRPREPLVPTGSAKRRWQSAATAPRELRQRIDEHALAQDLDPRLVEALIRVESAFNSRAVSNKGAMGLMQLMPSTASELGVENAFDVEENLRGGTSYLRSLLDRFSGDLTLALAGYNAGPGAVEKYRGVPPYRETTEYVRRVLAAYGAPASARGGSAAAAAGPKRQTTTGSGIIRVVSPPTASRVAAARVAPEAGR